MSTATITNSAQSPIWKSAWPVLLGLLVLYFPVYNTLASTLWQHEEYAHGPIILVIVLWLMWAGRSKLIDDGQKKNTVSGAILLFIGLLLYVVGHF